MIFWCWRAISLKNGAGVKRRNRGVGKGWSSERLAILLAPPDGAGQNAPMKVQLKKIAPFQAGKMLAALYGLMALLMVPFFVIAMAAGSFASQAQGAGSNAAPMAMAFGMGIGFMIAMPLIYAVMGFVFGVLGALLYNFLAKWIGGFEVEFEQQPPSIG